MCSWDGVDVNGLGALVFIGNLGLVFGALVVIFLLHVALVSGVEAYWLAKVRVRGFELLLLSRRGLLNYSAPPPPVTAPLLSVCAPSWCSLVVARFRG